MANSFNIYFQLIPVNLIIDILLICVGLDIEQVHFVQMCIDIIVVIKYDESTLIVLSLPDHINILCINFKIFCLFDYLLNNI